mmetsp:Transcript_8543/g.13191  ORF Transcript_8543/g.13191 Transcript_8543/m.13191 type:complete len:103 (+) Transcript_8543:922-1230(+)
MKTPQGVSVRILVARCLKDKVPKGEYCIRASVLDRLVQNKMQFKFIEYGQRIKDEIAKEKKDAERKAEAPKFQKLDGRTFYSDNSRSQSSEDSSDGSVNEMI